MSENEIVNIIVALFLLAGVFLSLVSTFGLLRLPDIYSRSHATTKSATLGVMLILLGTLIFFYAEKGLDARLLLGILFMLSTAPIGGHFIGRAAYFSGVKLANNTVRDDLKEVVKERKALYKEGKEIKK